MKIKYYLRGLGTGIIFTAIVLMIIYSYRTTDSKTIERARELGMVMPGETTKQTPANGDKKTDKDSTDEKNTPDMKEDNTSDKETKDDTKEQSSGNNNEQEGDTTETTAKEPDTKEPAATETTAEKQTEEEQNAEKPAAEEQTAEKPTSAGTEVTFTISVGMYSEQVSQRLQELGVVDDASGFNSYLVQNGYSGRIKTGTYTLTAGMSYADVAAIISQ